MRFLSFACCLLVGIGASATGSAAEKPLPQVAPEMLGLSAEAFVTIDAAVREVLDRGSAPGVVVVIIHNGAVVFRKAYGYRSVEPAKTPMLPEVVFDLASLTKPIATASALMLLVEQGKLKVSDPLCKYLPAFRRKETEKITLEQLLLHTSGFIPDNPETDYKDGIARAWERLFALNPVATPGSRFAYSDVNYILLGKVVETVSGEPLDVFTHEHLYAPLGMNETGFKPQGKRRDRAAPTEKRDDHWMLGEVHDPRAFALGGVAGHAGLFSTGDDLAVYAQMLLRGGQYDGKRILTAGTVQLMITPREVPLKDGKKGLRTYGWDMQTSYSGNRGDVFPVGVSYGHSGFTGTSIWIDPRSQSALILLSNGVHPRRNPKDRSILALRHRVATLAATAVGAGK
jgi:CubicO group peptidase (beta-lactamase class C family)